MGPIDISFTLASSAKHYFRHGDLTLAEIGLAGDFKEQGQLIGALHGLVGIDRGPGTACTRCGFARV
jgi:hypothetical protein